jgi:hypothetical protein
MASPDQERIQEKADNAARKKAEDSGSAEAKEALGHSYAYMIERALEAREGGRFSEMTAILRGILVLQGSGPDPYVVQQLALATYKAGVPSPTEALLEAQKVMYQLNPRNSLDAETIGLWGAIHKRLASAIDRSDVEKKEDLDEAIDALDRAFGLLRDHYNGINVAFLYDLRASRTEGAEAEADRVIARRRRSRVMEITGDLLARGISGETATVTGRSAPGVRRPLARPRGRLSMSRGAARRGAWIVGADAAEDVGEVGFGIEVLTASRSR